MRRIATLKEEVSRVAENITLSHSEKVKINAAKYSAMMAPIAVALERRLASTSRVPETAHEAWFQKEYGEQLKAAITNFKTPPSTAASLADMWRPFDIIAASLANHQKKSSVYLSEVAPRLAQLASSDAPMPGLEKQISMSESVGFPGSDLLGLVTISSFSEQVTILATKTKPKKLVLLGSDGQRYTYLLKGREDLRLDARIMQLLQAVNGMLHASTSTQGHSLAVRYYSVTPISGRAGLIQWVDNLISMYSVFKAWQQRAQYAQFTSTTSGTAAANTPIPPVPRPSDMFYGKIIPALKEKGLRKVISRRDWPQEVKRKVLLDLMKETPRQLLYREIWCASEGFQTFSSKLQR
jgi:PI-3-kinase-related kinase SMG-1